MMHRDCFTFSAQGGVYSLRFASSIPLSFQPKERTEPLITLSSLLKIENHFKQYYPPAAFLAP